MTDTLDRLEQYDYFNNEYFEKAITKYSEAIGKFLMMFSLLENELNIAVSEIINDRSHEIGYVILERLNMSNKIELFYKMYNMLENSKVKDSKSKLKELRGSLIEINDFRNQLAHANWETIQKDGNVRFKFVSDKESGEIIFRNIVVKPKDIRSKINEIEKVCVNINKYKERVWRNK